eukprot:m.20270 g.20270  ORF g.20270 m.20270 type:complete len:322 (-) comp5233_c0_seq1:221-1186(-)
MLMLNSVVRGGGVAASRWTLASRTLVRASSQFVEESLYEKALESQKNNDLYFRNIDLNEVDFKTEDEKILVVYRDTEHPSLLHMSPFCLTGVSFFQPNGDLGIKQKFGSTIFTVDDPVKANIQLSLSDRDPLTGKPGNQEAHDYADWLATFNNKLAEHIASNLTQYPDLNKKFSFLSSASPSVLFDGISNSIPKPAKEWVNSKDNSIVTFVNLKQPLYSRKFDKESVPRTFTELDEEVSETHVRNFVPLYDETGVMIPVQDAVVKNGDLISCVVSLQPAVYSIGGNAGVTVRRRIRNVTKIFSSKISSSSTQSAPLGNLSD